jgi:hypothetical protein
MKAITIRLFLSVLMALAVGPAFAKASDCSYCDRLEKVKISARKLKPDSMNEKTIDQQIALVEQTADVLIEVLKKHKQVPAKDLERMVQALAVALPFDYENYLADLLVGTLKSRVQQFFDEVDRQEKAKKLTAAQADEIRTALGVSEQVIKHGQDPEAPGADELAPRK